MQRQYREKEGECFNTLRDVIKKLTGEELQTRQEILRKGRSSHVNIPRVAANIFTPKAIELLTVSETGKQTVTQVVRPAPYEMLSSTNPADTTIAEAHVGGWVQLCTFDRGVHCCRGYPAQSSHWPQTRQSNAEFDAQSACYTTQSRGQQYHYMSDMDSALVAQAGYQEYYSEDWS
ncbi:hypothetical protein J3R83DRAFT_5073 [Lanmaoa asiatica]|nr:hypothetical protein J3R83DRAFT_5073 [Lanmaoa asiatica]